MSQYTSKKDKMWDDVRKRYDDAMFQFPVNSDNDVDTDTAKKLSVEYERGYNVGYDVGYSTGYNEALNVTVESDDANIDWLSVYVLMDLIDWLSV